MPIRFQTTSQVHIQQELLNLFSYRKDNKTGMLSPDTTTACRLESTIVVT